MNQTRITQPESRHGRLAAKSVASKSLTLLKLAASYLTGRGCGTASVVTSAVTGLRFPVRIFSSAHLLISSQPRFNVLELHPGLHRMTKGVTLRVLVFRLLIRVPALALSVWAHKSVFKCFLTRPKHILWIVCS